MPNETPTNTAELATVTTPNDPPVGGESGGEEFSLSQEVMESNDLDSIELPGETPAAPGTEPAPAATPATTPASPAVAKPTAAPAVAPAVAPVAAPAPAQPVAQPQPTASPASGRVDIGKLVKDLETNRAPLLENIAQQRFVLSQDEKDLLETDAVSAIPKIMSRVFFEASVNSLNQIMNLVPKIVEETTQAAMQYSQAETEFYSHWPNIDRGKHDNIVAQYASVFRQMNPKASRSDAIQFVGNAVTQALGLPVPQRNGGAQPPQRPAAGRPFAPASGTSGARVVAAQTGGKPLAVDPYSGMGEVFDE